MSNSLDSVDGREAFDELDGLISEDVCPGLEIVGSTPEQTMQYVRDQIARWTKIIKAAGIKAE